MHGTCTHPLSRSGLSGGAGKIFIQQEFIYERATSRFRVRTTQNVDEMQHKGKMAEYSSCDCEVFGCAFRAVAYDEGTCVLTMCTIALLFSWKS